MLPAGLAVLGPFSINQFITGSLVNMILILVVFKVGIIPAISTGVVSSFMAMILQIGPIFPQLVVFIALANIIFVTLIYIINKSKIFLNENFALILALATSSVMKFLFLKLTIPFALELINNISDVQVKTLTIMFSWPQLITAITGSILALLLKKYLKKAF